MAMLDYGLLVKILGLTQSSNDGEALNAMRKANDMLKRAGMQWSQVVAVVQSSANASTFNNSFADEILRRATESQRARNFGEELRAKQQARDQAYSEMHERGETSYGWTEKGPYHHAYTSPPEPDPPEPDDLEIEKAAREMTEHIEGDAHQTNWFIFAMTEPELAKWLFGLREGHAFHRILFKQICERGDLSGPQLDVCQRMMERDQRK